MLLGNPVALAFIGVFFIILALVFFMKALVRKLRFKNKTVGKILSIETSLHTVRVSRNGGYSQEKRYTPNVAFTFEGKSIQGKGTTVFLPNYYKEGGDIEICFSPSHPEKFVTTPPRNTFYGGFIFLGLALIFFITAIIKGGWT